MLSERDTAGDNQCDFVPYPARNQLAVYFPENVPNVPPGLVCPDPLTSMQVSTQVKDLDSISR
jgi:hypothetical protein